MGDFRPFPVAVARCAVVVDAIDFQCLKLARTYSNQNPNPRTKLWAAPAGGGDAQRLVLCHPSRKIHESASGVSSPHLRTPYLKR